MTDSILQAILANTNETKTQLDRVQDGLAKIEVITEQNRTSIDHLDKVVWKSMGESPTLLQTYADHNVKIHHLTCTVERIEQEFSLDMKALSDKLDQKNSLITTVILSIMMLILGGFVTYVFESHNR